MVLSSCLSLRHFPAFLTHDGLDSREITLGLADLHRVLDPPRRQLEPQVEDFLGQLLFFLGQLCFGEAPEVFHVHFNSRPILASRFYAIPSILRLTNFVATGSL